MKSSDIDYITVLVLLNLSKNYAMCLQIYHLLPRAQSVLYVFSVSVEPITRVSTLFLSDWWVIKRKQDNIKYGLS